MVLWYVLESSVERFYEETGPKAQRPFVWFSDNVLSFCNFLVLLFCCFRGGVKMSAVAAKFMFDLQSNWRIDLEYNKDPWNERVH